MQYKYTYHVEDFPGLTTELVLEAHALRYERKVLPQVRDIAVASGVHLEDGTFALELTLGLVKVTVKPL